MFEFCEPLHRLSEAIYVWATPMELKPWRTHSRSACQKRLPEALARSACQKRLHVDFDAVLIPSGDRGTYPHYLSRSKLSTFPECLFDATVSGWWAHHCWRRLGGAGCSGRGAAAYAVGQRCDAGSSATPPPTLPLGLEVRSVAAVHVFGTGIAAGVPGYPSLQALRDVACRASNPAQELGGTAPMQGPCPPP